MFLLVHILGNSMGCTLNSKLLRCVLFVKFNTKLYRNWRILSHLRGNANLLMLNIFQSQLHSDRLRTRESKWRNSYLYGKKA